jgi:hypothetical protein
MTGFKGFTGIVKGCCGQYKQGSFLQKNFFFFVVQALPEMKKPWRSFLGECIYYWPCYRLWSSAEFFHWSTIKFKIESLIFHQSWLAESASAPKKEIFSAGGGVGSAAFTSLPIRRTSKGEAPFSYYNILLT